MSRNKNVALSCAKFMKTIQNVCFENEKHVFLRTGNNQLLYWPGGLGVYWRIWEVQTWSWVLGID